MVTEILLAVANTTASTATGQKGFDLEYPLECSWINSFFSGVSKKSEFSYTCS